MRSLLLSPWSLPILGLAIGSVFAACSSGDDAPATPAGDDAAVDGALPTTETGDDTATDSGGADEAASDTYEAAVDAPPPPAWSTKLSEMGLYSDFASRTVAPNHHLYVPSYELWADGAGKNRYVYVPAGTKIDTSDMDHWDFPVGTRFYKEFGLGGKLLETRLIEKTAPDTWRFGAYVWNDAQTEATWSVDAQNDVLGTDHDVPSVANCQSCHEGEPGRILGFSAVQLAKTSGPIKLADLASWGWLTVNPTAGKEYGAPGNATESAAMGYLHANCGHCHNPNNVKVFLVVNQVLRLAVDQRVVSATDMFTTAVNQPTTNYKTVPFRIAGGSTAQSAVYVRMDKRGMGSGQMPNLATEHVHVEGEALVKAWIDTLPAPPDAGAGDAAPGG